MPTRLHLLWMVFAALLLALVFAPAVAVAQDTGAGDGDAAGAGDGEGEGDGDGGEAWTPDNRVDVEEKKPDWLLAWEPVYRDIVAVLARDPRDEKLEADLAEEITDWLTKYANISAATTDQAIGYLVTIIDNFKDPNNLTAGSRMARDLQDADLTGAQKRLLQAARVQALMDLAYIVPASAKVLRYQTAESQASTLVRQDLTSLDYRTEETLHLNHARALVKLGKIDQAVESWRRAIEGDQTEEGRRWGLVEALVEFLTAREEHLRVLDLIPLAERIGGENHRLDVLAMRARALMFVGRDQEMHEVFASMREIDPVSMALHRARINKQWTMRSGRQMPGFRLFDPTPAQQPHDLAEYRGRFALLLFVDISDSTNRSAWRRAMDIASRYNERELAIVTVSAGKAFGVTDEDQMNVFMPFNPETNARERDPDIKGHFIVDETGSVARSVGYGPNKFEHPGATLVDPDGAILFNSQLASNPRQQLYLRDALEESIELATGAGTVLPPETPERSPEWDLLQAIFDEIGIPADSPVRRARSVNRAGLLMGPAGRSDARAYLFRKYRTTEGEGRQLFYSLFQRLLEENFQQDEQPQ